ncbi:Hypothetical predicted protein [Mytilus galloprovincialis]|uniref:Uncharacterized protein n=1 Tax=Mytilus galloprovincialis TaxID=29158 RepID=A0A8B6HMY8_MYTGA|nr:Hypothetical predicted protein [Mytilus galloprovincialis]
MVHAILDKDNPTESLHAPVNTYSEDTTITTVSEEMSNADSQGSLWLPNSQDTDTSDHMDYSDIPHHGLICQ